jgi:hypothetical protein
MLWRFPVTLGQTSLREIFSANLSDSSKARRNFRASVMNSTGTYPGRRIVIGLPGRG